MKVLWSQPLQQEVTTIRVSVRWYEWIHSIIFKVTLPWNCKSLKITPSLTDKAASFQIPDCENGIIQLSNPSNTKIEVKVTAANKNDTQVSNCVYWRCRLLHLFSYFRHMKLSLANHNFRVIYNWIRKIWLILSVQFHFPYFMARLS